MGAGLNQELDRALRGRSDEIASTLNVDEPGGTQQGQQAQDAGLNFQNDPVVQSQDELVLIYDPNGTLLEGTGPQLKPLPAWAMPTGSARYITQVVGSGNWRLYVRPVPIAGGIGTLLVVRDLAGTEAGLRQTVTAVLVAGPVLLLPACVGGYFLAGRALAPIQRINQTARRIQAQDLTLRIGSSVGGGEIGELAQTIDEMLERLALAFERQRRFTADAAHELRTPLAVVTAEASLTLHRRRSPAEYRRVLETIVQESERLRVLVQDLLMLARTEQGEELGQPRASALSGICAEATARVSRQAAAKDVQIAADLTADPIVWGDPIWLGQMLENLLDNAVKYSPPGGLLRLRLREAEDRVYLEVADNGSGIEAVHLPHIFERFYRADAARSRDTEKAGLGLGLAICRWIAEAHGGTIEVESTPGQGASFTVRLPREPAAGRVLMGSRGQNSS